MDSIPPIIIVTSLLSFSHLLLIKHAKGSKTYGILNDLYFRLTSLFKTSSLVEIYEQTCRKRAFTLPDRKFEVGKTKPLLPTFLLQEGPQLKYSLGGVSILEQNHNGLKLTI